MDLLQNPVLAMVLMLGVLVFVHELGHFLVGIACGVGVEIFSIGFGPKLLGFKIKGVDFRLCVVPLGGFVKFVGSTRFEEVPEELHGKELCFASTWKKIAIISAGPLANLLLAAAVYSFLVAKGIPHPPPLIGEIRAGSPAEKAGLEAGDKVTLIAGKPVKTWEDLRKLISVAPGKELKVSVIRSDGNNVDVKLIPETVEGRDFLGRRTKIGRAGVALGSRSSVISVLDGDSPAALSGLTTGEVIERVRLSGEEVVTSRYVDFLNALHRAYKLDAQVIEIEVGARPKAGGEDAPPVLGGVRNLSVDTTSWYEGEQFDKEDVFHSRVARELAKKIGITDGQLTLSEVEEPSSQSLQPGDRLISWNGVPLKDFYDLADKLTENRSETVVLEIARQGESITADVAMKPIEVQRPEGKVTMYQLPVRFYSESKQPEPVIQKYSNLLDILNFGFLKTSEQAGLVVSSMAGLVTGSVPMKALGGPLMIAKVAGDTAKMGWQAFMNALALISINLGLINLFPIPVLDGGQLIVAALEGIRRKPLSQVAFENFQKLGFVLVFALVILATYNDLSRFWKSMLQGVSEFF